jgi:hypothetical protein
MNAVCQVAWHHEQWRNSLLGRRLTADSVSDAFQKVMNQMSQDRARHPASAANLVTQLCHRSEQPKSARPGLRGRGQQHDAHEGFTALVEEVDKDDQAAQGADSVFNVQPMGSAFLGYYHRERQCPAADCGEWIVCRDDNGLPIPEFFGDVRVKCRGDFQQQLDAEFAIAVVQMQFICPDCSYTSDGANVPIRVRNTFRRFPEILPAMVRRFLFQDGATTKVQSEFAIPSQVTLGGQAYALTACVRHEGDTPDSGHYTAWCKEGSQWVHWDDQTGSRHSEAEALRKIRKDGYLAFFTKGD